MSERSYVHVGVDGRSQVNSATAYSEEGERFLQTFDRVTSEMNERDARTRRVCLEAGARHVVLLDGWLTWPTKERDCAAARRGRLVVMPDEAELHLFCCPAEVGDLVAVVQSPRGDWNRHFFTLYRVDELLGRAVFFEPGTYVRLRHQYPTKPVRG